MPTDEAPTTPPAPTPYDGRHIGNLRAAMRNFRHPKQIGEFEILEVIGEGGMGIVYKAEQHTPIQRTVAIKIIKPGMDAFEDIRRFNS